MHNWLIVVPARIGSSRLQSKPLQLVGDRPLVLATCRNLQPLVDQGARLLVVTDSDKIANLTTAEGIETAISEADFRCGTDRVAAVAVKRSEPMIMNVQVDEPFIAPSDLEKLAKNLEGSPHGMATLVFGLDDEHQRLDPDIVKVVMNAAGEAVYFSRAPIPHQKSGRFYKHLGIYAFRRDSLLRFADLPPADIEVTEKLEQLRAISHDMKILCVDAEHDAIGINNNDDLKAAKQRVRTQPGLR